MQKATDITHSELDLLRDPATRRVAFDRMVERCLRPLYWHARRLMVRHDEAQDVVQEAFVHAYDHLDAFRGGEEQFTAWLYRIVTNTALTALRRQKRGLFCSIDEVSRELATVVAECAPEQADRLLIRFQQEVLNLPLKQRLVFNLRYYDELSYAQIARILGQNEQALRANYFYAEKRLKERLLNDIL